MTISEYKRKVKVGTYLLDDVGFAYKVIDKLPNSIIVQAVGGIADLGCEVIPFTCLVNEKWRILKTTKYAGRRAKPKRQADHISSGEKFR